MSACCRLAGYLMGAVVPLQEATGLRSLTIEHLPDSYSLGYLPLLTQLTELRMGSCDRIRASLVVGANLKAPLADMTGLRALSLGVSDGWAFQLCHDNSVDQADLPLVLPPHLTRLEMLVTDCEPGAFWRHIAACSQLVDLTVNLDIASVPEDHPSWMMCCLAGSLPHLQHFTVMWHGSEGSEVTQGVLGLLADTEEAQQQQEEQGWDWEDVTAPGLGWASVPPPNMGGLTALRTLHFPLSQPCGCCSPHHWHALAGCRSLQQLYGLDAWAVPPAGVKFPGVTDLKMLVSTPLGDTVAVLGAFPALQKLWVVLHPVPALAGTATQQVKPSRVGDMHMAAHLYAAYRSYLTAVLPTTRACSDMCLQCLT
jgi:hypothetical protein